jgi:anti-sigma factor RsiW
MKCDEAQTLYGPYLDSELDARTSLEIEQHLKACPACARLFAEEEKLEARIKASLKRGQRTPALWAQIERSVSESLTQRREGTQRNAERMHPLRLSASLCVSALTRLRAGWQRSRWAWAGLAAVWAVILALNGTARESGGQIVAGRQLPPAAEVRFAVEQKHLLMADLAFPTEPAPADKPKAAPPSPRSDRRKATLNT